jgi:hypothetical protein
VSGGGDLRADEALVERDSDETGSVTDEGIARLGSLV